MMHKKKVSTCYISGGHTINQKFSQQYILVRREQAYTSRGLCAGHPICDQAGWAIRTWQNWPRIPGDSRGLNYEFGTAHAHETFGSLAHITLDFNCVSFSVLPTVYTVAVALAEKFITVGVFSVGTSLRSRSEMRKTLLRRCGVMSDGDVGWSVAVELLVGASVGCPKSDVWVITVGLCICDCHEEGKVSRRAGVRGEWTRKDIPARGSLSSFLDSLCWLPCGLFAPPSPPCFSVPVKNSIIVCGKLGFNPRSGWYSTNRTVW